MFENVKMPTGINKEVLEHLMQPKNYGKLEDANGVGVALDEKTQEYVIFYTKLDGEKIQKVRFATNGCQDTVVIGSMYTDMITNNTVDYANEAIERMHEKLGTLSQQQQVCADIVFTAFIASMKNYENRQKGLDEELHLLKMKQSCEVNEDE